MSGTPKTGAGTSDGLMIHLVDGTYELFRHFYGLRALKNGSGPSARRPECSTPYSR